LGENAPIVCVIEIAKRGEPVDNPIESCAPWQVAHVAVNVIDRDGAGFGILAGQLQEQRRRVQAREVASPLRQSGGDAPVTAGQVQHLHAGFLLVVLVDQTWNSLPSRDRSDHPAHREQAIFGCACPKG